MCRIETSMSRAERELRAAQELVRDGDTLRGHAALLQVAEAAKEAAELLGQRVLRGGPGFEHRTGSSRVARRRATAPRPARGLSRGAVINTTDR